MEMNNIMAVAEGTEGILGKLFYYTLNGILVEKETLKRIGADMGLPKICPARESKASAYHRATAALRDRVTMKSSNGLKIYSVYCRNNKNDSKEMLCRELVKETPQAETNEYLKLANIVYDVGADVVGYGNMEYDPDVDVQTYCDRAVSLFELYRKCYDTAQIDSVIKSQLENMNAVKIGIKGNLYFIPNSHLTELSVLEDYIDAVGRSREDISENSYVCCNSMYVANDDKQRQKMADEFYRNFQSTLEDYQNRIQHFIDGGCTSKAVIERWLQKIEELNAMKRTYETTLQRQLNKLDTDQAMLEMQMHELRLRAQDKNQLDLMNGAVDAAA